MSSQPWEEKSPVAVTGYQRSEVVPIADQAVGWVARHSGWSRRSWLALLFLLAISFFVAPPNLMVMTHPSHWTDQALDWKINHPFAVIPAARYGPPTAPDLEGIRSHLRKRTYRVTVPLIAHLLHLHILGARVIAFLFGCGFVWLLFLNARRIFEGDSASALLLAVGFAGSFVVQWGLNNFFFFDASGYFFLAAACLTRWPWLIAGTLVAGGFCDERVLFALPLLYLLYGDQPVSRLSFRGLLRLNRARVGALSGVILFGVLRVAFALRVHQIWDRTDIGWPFFSNLLIAPVNVLLVFKGTALVLIVGSAVLAFRGSRIALPILLAAALPSFFATLVVIDTARSLAYAFPLVFLCATALWEIGERKHVQRLLFYAAAVSFVLPTYFLWQGRVVPYQPLVYTGAVEMVHLLVLAGKSIAMIAIHSHH